MKTNEQYLDYDGTIVNVVVEWYVVETGEVFGTDNEQHNWFAWLSNGHLINKQRL